MAGAPVKELEEVEYANIQGLVFGGFGKLPAAKFVLLRVLEGKQAEARAFLARIKGEIAGADEVREWELPDAVIPEVSVQIAFTSTGLRALGVRDEIVKTFSREFIEGLDDSVRSDALGDRGKNDPKDWLWGRKEVSPVDVLLLVYAKTEPLLDAWLGREERAMRAAFSINARPTQLLSGSREHFGWRDGISTPVQEKYGDKVPQWTDPIRIGEFVLGYRNEYKGEHDTYNETPTVDPADDPAGLLDVARDGERKDLGRNGSYLVYREMTQDVKAFWRYCRDESREGGADTAEAAIRLGSKMVGRWPGGAPIMTSPTDDHTRSRDNDFLYYQDKHGLGCPIGSHIRRTNPRDHLAVDRGDQDSLEMVRKHQMLRRGRPFGKPLDDSLDPRRFLELLDEPDLRGPRGLHFICLVAHLARQFEFVQRGWIDSANFLGMSKDGDPIAAARRTADDPNPNDEFTVPAVPVRRKYKAMPAFTQVVGGAYFFLPGRKAMRFIVGDPPP